MIDELIDELLAATDEVRYVAVRLEGTLVLRQKAGLAHASAAESDRYEELIVNPTLLTLLRQRGEIDCGGLEYALVRYGSFFQFVHPLPAGHVSVSLEPASDPLALIPALREVITRHLGRSA
jgi:hypothetical protein